MRAKKLSARFEAMAGFVCAGERVADIGTDHALLPIFLVKEGLSPFAVLTDISPGPLEKARLGVEKAMRTWVGAASSEAYNDRVSERDDKAFDLRLGDGLDVLKESEVDTVIIAGIGGETIISILEADPDKTESFPKFILQPRTKTGLLEKWLAGSDWKILEKTAAEERGRLCDIIVCTPNVNARKEVKQ